MVMVLNKSEAAFRRKEKCFLDIKKINKKKHTKKVCSETNGKS